METITATELSKKLGVTSTTLTVHLSRFPAFAIEKGTRYIYTYNEEFLNTIKKFYENKTKNYTGKYLSHYYSIIFKIENLIKAKKNEKDKI